MANPQKEKGYTPIANEILEHLILVRLSGSQFRIILAVLRYTYGFSRKQHELSDSYLAKAIGVSRHNLNRDINPLFKMNILTVIKRGQADGTRSILAFNKDYETWNISNLITGIGNDTNPVIEIDTTPAIKNDTKSSINFDTQEKKERKQELKQDNKRESPANKTDRADIIVTSNKKYGDYGWLALSEDEYSQLISEFGKSVADHYIAIVDNRAQANSNRYGWKDWNLKVRQAIRENWGDNNTVKKVNTTVSRTDADYSMPFIRRYENE
jgi:phage replication O-like protein O